MGGYTPWILAIGIPKQRSASVTSLAGSDSLQPKLAKVARTMSPALKLGRAKFDLFNIIEVVAVQATRYIGVELISPSRFHENLVLPHRGYTLIILEVYMIVALVSINIKTLFRRDATGFPVGGLKGILRSCWVVLSLVSPFIENQIATDTGRADGVGRT